MKKKLRHHIVFFILTPIVRIYLRFRYNFKPERFKRNKDEGPYLILSNHVQALDPFFVTTSFNFPIFYVASDMVMSIKRWPKVIKYMASPISKTKVKSDAETVKDIIRMVRSGGSIGLFPEGNQSFSGEPMPIAKSVAKLVKMLKIPVILYNIEGGYLTHPRWAKKSRKGQMRGMIKYVIEPDELKAMSLDELYDMIVTHLTVDDYAVMKDVAFKGKEKALYLENAIYYCPNCKSMHSLNSDGDYVFCNNCDFEVLVDNQGYFKGDDAIIFHETPMAWFNAQKDALNELLIKTDVNQDLFEEAKLEALITKKNQPKISLGTVGFKASKSNITFCFSDRLETWSILDTKAAIQQKNKLILYNKALDVTYYLLGTPRFNAYKYLELIELVKGEVQHGL